MQTATPSPVDEPLYNLVKGLPLATIPDVIARMQAIDELLPVTDGLKWFNRLYLMVTQQVDLCPPGGAWQCPVWLDRLDIQFESESLNDCSISTRTTIRSTFEKQAAQRGAHSDGHLSSHSWPLSGPE